MIFVIFYTIILMFVDRESITTQCLTALKQWYETMIPTLFPMMLLSSIAVDTGIALEIGSICNKTLFRFLKLSDQGCYCLITGFLFGFPMGAKTASDMMEKNYISAKEAEYLLSFINCIGPMYIIHFIHTMFQRYSLWTLITGIYILPLFYGLLLRYTAYKTFVFHTSDTIHSSKNYNKYNTLCFPEALYQCVPKCGKNILLLGGYMILFQISFIPLEYFLQSLNIVTQVFYPLLEMTGGLLRIAPDTSLALILFYLSFGGACCLLQTYSIIHPTRLSVRKYAFHKLLLGLTSALYGIILEIF